MISGQGLQSYDGRSVELKPGMTIRIPARVKHNMVNTGTEPFRTVISFSSSDGLPGGTGGKVSGVVSDFPLRLRALR